MDSHLKRAVVLLALFAFFVALFTPGALLFAKKKKKQPTEDVLIAVAKANYDKIAADIEAMGGTVRYRYKYIDALAVTIPKEDAPDLGSKAEVLFMVKDRKMNLPTPPKFKRPGYDQLEQLVTFSADDPQAMSVSNLAEFVEVAPDNYEPYTTGLTRSLDLFLQEGLDGTGVIVGVMDTGTDDDAVSLAGRVLPGENFVPVFPPLDDGLSATSSANDPHGTWVASCIASLAFFGFSPTSTFANAVLNYAPGSAIDLGPVIVVPMIGQAPGATIFPLKIFNVDAVTAGSIILAAMDRAIELKELYDAGDPSGVNLQVVNMSFGGPSLFAGDDPFFAELVEEMWDAGIVVVASAGNSGPSGMTGGDPGLAENILTVGATDDATHERILIDLFFGFPGLGALWRPVDNHQTALFSSRGPTADGRVDPDITAPGRYRYAEGSGGFLALVSGTSFSAPTVAGVVAQLLQYDPSLTPDEIRGAMLNGANPNILTDNSTDLDQGFGFVDALGAFNALGSKNPKDKGRAEPSVRKNIQKHVGVKNILTKGSLSKTVTLAPGERAEWFVDVDKKTDEVNVSVTGITPTLPPGSQNPLFGDDLIIQVVSAKTSVEHILDAAFFTTSDQFFSFPAEEIDRGLMRVTLVGSWTNAGDITATVHIEKVKGKPDLGKRVARTKVKQGQLKTFTFDVPVGATHLDVTMEWKKDWGDYPTNDFDLFLEDPSGLFFFEGATFDSPERVSITSPEAGTWTAYIFGFTVWQKPDDKVKLWADIDLGGPKLAGEADPETGEIALVPDEFMLMQNYPNPFNPETRIQYGLPKASEVSLQVFNIRGQLVRTLVQETKPAGFYTVTWDGRDERGVQVPSGTYIYRLQAGEAFTKTQKMTLLK